MQNFLHSTSGFPTGVENMGGGSSTLQNLMGGLSQHLGEAWGGGGLKMLSKNAFEGVHLIVKLPAISLQACKFTKNELFFPKNLAISIINTLDKNGLKYRKEKFN